MDFSTFLETHAHQWPLGKVQTLHQVHHLAVDSPFAHPLQDNEFLHTADLIQVTVTSHKAHPLRLDEVKSFTKKIIAIAPEKGEFVLHMEVSETLQDTVIVRLLALQMQESRPPLCH